jgi:hypothetical protein
VHPWINCAKRTTATLFAPEAAYRTAPFEEPFRGLAAIAAIWEAGRDGPDEVFTMRSEVTAVEVTPGWRGRRCAMAIRTARSNASCG